MKSRGRRSRLRATALFKLPVVKLWAPKTTIAWQMWGSTQWNRKCRDFQGTLRLAVDAGSTYVEIYQEDLLIPELARFAEGIHRELKVRASGGKVEK